MSATGWREPPTLSGHRALLRPTRLSDVDGLIAAHQNDDETLRYFPYGIESEPPSERTVAHALASGRQVLTQIDALTGRVVGMTALYNMSEAHRRVTIGYTWLSQSVRGTGFNREAKVLLLDHVFDGLAARRAEFNVDNENARSRRAVLALGATEEGALRGHARRRDGSWRTTIVYSILAEEWPRLRSALAPAGAAG
ncbi:MAG TPA: GNAT family protein [Conexibacter sp.]|jgi:RimJ/RimL family protein N-acetyltransferase